MFSGITTHTGKINKIYRRNNNCILEIESNMPFKKEEIGSSISCSGACLTLEKYKKKIARFYLSKETLKKTTFKTSKIGDIINLDLIPGDSVGIGTSTSINLKFGFDS